jgi:DNA-binding LacI/PurR family transcriptional regulator
MEDVAREAGYSIAAVSMALRGDRSIPEATRKAIAKVAKQLGYRTNPLVAALMSLQRKRRRPSAKASTAIALLITHLEQDPRRRHTSYQRMYEGASARAKELGWSLAEFDLTGPGMTPARMRRILLTRNIHAVVVAPLPHQSTTIDFDFSDLAVVGLGMSVCVPIIERVANDHYQSAALAVRKCIELGYKRPGLVLSQETSHRLDHRWLGGYRFAMEQFAPGTRLSPLMTERTEQLAPALSAWEKRENPDVVIFGNLEKELLEQTKAHSVSLAVDNQQGFLTGIFQNYEVLGAVAVEHAVAKLQTNSFGTLPFSQLHLVEGIWVPGSSAPGPTHSRRVKIS